MTLASPRVSARRRDVFRLCIVTAIVCSPFVAARADSEPAEHFDRVVAPVLAHHCLSCHSGDAPKGGLNLSTRETAMAGGENGSPIAPGKAAESLLWQYVASDEMPPKTPLSEAEKSLLKGWIEQGAIWGTDTIDPHRFSTDKQAGLDWWSLQPLATLQPPVTVNSAWNHNPIDRFVDARRNAAGLAPAPPADRRTLIRRLSFDLLGLPPTPEQVAEFLADPSDQAYENLVDRLLNSPHYGERWARHWLDIVRFGESNGFEYDQPRDNAWPYRNWVIAAFNQDMPYDEFVRQQLAGDIFYPDDADAAAAVGFLVAGAHNTTLPSNQIMRMSMAQDELEDLVGVVGQTFLGLTANCARCHDHKFDPISQKEYYQLAAALTGVSHGERDVRRPRTPAQQQRIEQINARLLIVAERLKTLVEPIRERIIAERKIGDGEQPTPPEAMATWTFDDDLNDSRGNLHGTAFGGAHIKDGALVLDGTAAWVATAPLKTPLQEKTIEAWVQLDNLEQRGGGVISIQSTDGVTFDAIVFGEREPNVWMAGSNGFVRTQSFSGTAEDQSTQRAVHVAIVYQKDGSIIGYREGQPYGKPYQSGGLQVYAADTTQIVFGLRHGTAAGGNRMLTGRIHRAQLYNRALTPDEVAASAGVADINDVSDAQIVARLSPAQHADRESLLTEITTLQTERDELINAESLKLYTCVPTTPGVTHLLKRGNVTEPGEAVSPNGLRAIAAVQPDFGLAPDAPDAARRRQLATWITDHNNPLLSRVMVNRLWHYHFGQGLVTTPSDFGYNGGLPSHPELLEWLATSFRDNGFHLKPLHRLIVTSATYRQSALHNDAAAKVDSDNRLLWRKTPQRLEAEAIRDAVLQVTGRLDHQVGGIGYRDVRHFAFKGSNFYEPLAEAGTDAASYRRTIYRFSPRGGRNPFLDTFDCPDPSSSSPRRAATTTPLQALALMNNELVFAMADDFAARVQRQAGDDVDQQIGLVFELAYSRKVTQDELPLTHRFVQEQGLPSLCRVILNSNEFLYVR